MSDDQFERLIEHLAPAKIVEQNAFERHAQTGLTSIVVLLLAGVVGFIFQINNSQSEQLIEMRVLQFQVEALSQEVKGATGSASQSVSRLERSIDTIWPRLRSHGENVEIVTREVERLCNCKINLNEPDKF
jgi:hypothetical protein